MGPVWYSRYGVYIEEIKYGYVSKIMFCPRLVSMRVVPSLTGYKCKTRKQKISTSPISPWGGKIQNNQILSHNAYFLEAVECCCVSQLLHCVKMHLPPTSPPPRSTYFLLSICIPNLTCWEREPGSVRQHFWIAVPALWLFIDSLNREKKNIHLFFKPKKSYL